ncbi:sporulation protein [Bacillus testis]|uniref:sporulation protein n=1 Tax=Bacillus testis TaxID=1622072 RepID=UPI000841141F|nr:sporulation protein [Bacillus testis]
MLKKCMRLLKIGCTNVNLVLDTKEYRCGDLVSGHFQLTGGRMNETIKRLECDLLIKDCKNQKVLSRESAATILMTKTLGNEESIRIAFKYQLPDNLQPSSDQVVYMFHTRVIFYDNHKGMDYDEIRICS